MASLQERNGSFRVLFSYHGKLHAFTIGKVERSEAEAKARQVDYPLMRLKQRLLTLPDGIDIVTFLQHDGKPPDAGPTPGAAPGQTVTLGHLKDRYLVTYGNGTIEASSLDICKIHLGHFRRVPREGMAVGTAAHKPIPDSVLRLTNGIPSKLAFGRWSIAAAVMTVMTMGLAAGIGLSGAAKDADDPPDSKVAKPATGNTWRVDVKASSLPAEAVAQVGSNRLRHGRPYCNLTASPDGRLLATSGGGRLRLWDARTGQHLQHISCPGPNVGPCGQFSADSRTVLAIQGPNCRWLDVTSGKEIRRCQIALPDEWKYSYGNNAIASRGDGLALYDGQSLFVYDLPSGKQRHRWAFKSGDMVCPTFSPDGRTLSAVVPDAARGKSVLHLFEVETGNRVGNFDLPQDEIFCDYCISPDGTLLVSHGFRSHKVYVWKLPDGAVLHKFEGGEVRQMLAFTGRILAYNGSDQKLALVDTVTGKELRHLPAFQCRNGAFSPDGKIVTVSNDAGIISRWDHAAGRRLDQSAEPVDRFTQLRFSADGNRLLGWAGDFFELDWPSSKETRHFSDPVPDSKYSLTTVSRDGLRLTRLQPSTELGVWDTATGKKLLKLDFRDDPRRQYQFSSRRIATLSPDGRTLYGSDRDGVLRAWEVDDGKEYKPSAEEIGNLWLVAVSANGQRLAVARNVEAGLDGTEVVVLDLRSGRILHRFCAVPGNRELTGNVPGGLYGLVLSPDGSLVAATGRMPRPDVRDTAPNLLTVVDVRTGICRLRRTDLTESLTSAAFAPDGRTLTTAGDDSFVRLWEVASGKERHAFTSGDTPYCVAFSPDGKLLASAGSGPIVIWDVTGRAALPTSAEAFAQGEKDGLWQALADTDAEKAYAAMRRLLARDGRAVGLLAEHLQRVADVDEKELNQVLRELEADAFNVREEASSRLERLADVIQEPLRATLARGVSAEVKRRLEKILSEIDAPVPGRLRQLRAVEVLEQIGTPEAITLLKKLATGVPGARLTREAKASLLRLYRKRGT
jgi:WD40 repeat protein